MRATLSWHSAPDGRTSRGDWLAHFSIVISLSSRWIAPSKAKLRSRPASWPSRLRGHTPGSYCYLDTVRGVAFVGDLVISHVDGLARPMQSSNADEAQYLETLRRFAERAPEVGCPGHGAPVLSEFGTQLLGLSLLPRGITGMFSVVRFRRLWRFTFGMSRRRKKSGH